MKEQFDILKPLIRNLVHGELHSISNSVLEEIQLQVIYEKRKEFAMNRIRNLISKHNLGLRVYEDDSMKLTDRFIIAKN